MDGYQEKKESLWQEMLESILTEKIEQTGNVLIFGDPFCGKKRIIELMNTMAGTKQFTQNKHQDLEKVYVMDFKYIRIKKSREEENEDRGKINFYIINKKYESMKQFFNSEMFKNLMVVVVLDMDKPEEMTKSFVEWHDYCYKIVREFLQDVEIQKRQKIFQGFEKTLNLMKDMKGDVDTVIENKDQNLEGEIQEESEQDSENEQEEKVAGESQEEMNLDNFKLPILIIGNKSDVIDSINNENTLEYMAYILRKLAVQNQSALMNVSSYQDINLNSLLQFFYLTILNRDNDYEILKPCFNIKNMFIPLGTDDMNFLKNKYKSIQNYVIPKTEKESEEQQEENNLNIDYIQNFFENLKKENYIYSSEQKKTYSTRRIDMGSSRMIGSNKDFATNRTDKIRNILKPNQFSFL